MSFQVGDIVRDKNTGREFTLDDVNENPDYKEDDEYFASGWGSYGTEEVDNPEDIELVMSAQDASSRTLPSAEEIAAGLDLLGDGWGSPVNVTGTEKDGNSILCYGRAHDGLEVQFRVTVSDVYEGDY